MNIFVLEIQVTGKAVMLDEIINYVQSLQRQVEVITNIPPIHYSSKYAQLCLNQGLSTNQVVIWKRESRINRY